MQARDDINQLSGAKSHQKVATHAVVTTSGTDSWEWQFTGCGGWGWGVGGDGGGTGRGLHHLKLQGECEFKALWGERL